MRKSKIDFKKIDPNKPVLKKTADGWWTASPTKRPFLDFAKAKTRKEAANTFKRVVMRIKEERQMTKAEMAKFKAMLKKDVEFWETAAEGAKREMISAKVNSAVLLRQFETNPNLQMKKMDAKQISPERAYVTLVLNKKGEVIDKSLMVALSLSQAKDIEKKLNKIWEKNYKKTMKK